MSDTKTASKQATIPGSAVETGRALVPVEAPSDVYRVIERADEDLVAAEIRGDVIETMAYQFDQGGKTIRGLSYKGVNAVVREMNARGIGRVAIAKDPRPTYKRIINDEGEESWDREVYAEDLMVGGGAWGLADQPLLESRRDGKKVPDRFAKRKALSKAQRNAKEALIPEALRVEILAAFALNQVREITTPREAAVAGAARQLQADNAQTRADQPRRTGQLATAAQRRLIHARFKERGGEQAASELGVPGEQLLKAILGYVAESIHEDRLPKNKVDEVAAALDDIPGQVVAIQAEAAQGSTSAQWLVENLLTSAES